MPSLGEQILWLFILALPIACISWTVTHEEVFREPREFAVRKSRDAKSLVARKFFYLFTCEYCFAHYVTLAFLIITGYKLLYPDWRGYLVSFFSLPFISNVYIGLYAQTKLEAKKDRLESKIFEHEAEIKKIEKQQKAEEQKMEEESSKLHVA